MNVPAWNAEKNKLEVNIDATALRTSGCMLEFWRTIVDGYRQPLVSSSIIYGVGVHKFIDTMFKSNGNLKLAVEEAKRSFMIPKHDDNKKPHLSDWRHCLATSVDYWDNYVSKDSTYDILKFPDGSPATEVTFKFKYYEDDYIIVNLAGTIDKLGQIKRGCYAVGDYKTTSAWDNEGYFKQYERSIQLRFYVLALKWMAEKYPDSLLGQIGATRVGAFIDALFINAKVVENKYKRSEVFTYKDEELDEVKGMLNHLIRCLSHMAGLILSKIETRPPKTGLLHGICEKKFSKCMFWHVCNAPDDIAEILLKRDFKQKFYDPLKFNE